MEKNYYEILEIDKNASQEIIEKAYKVLVKKYHPDLQTSPEMKLKYESKIKEINESYETLSDNSKKEIYDNSLKNSENDFNNLYQENINLKNELNNLKNNSYKNTTSNFKNDNYNNLNNISENNINNNYKNNNLKDYFQNTLKKAYHDAYIDDMKNKGYKIKYKKTCDDYLRSFISLFITIGIIILVLQIPFVKNYFYNLYINNPIIHDITNVIINLFNKNPN